MCEELEPAIVFPSFNVFNKYYFTCHTVHVSLHQFCAFKFWIFLKIVMYFVLSGGDQQVRVITLLRCQIPITNHVLSIEQNRLAGELQVVQV